MGRFEPLLFAPTGAANIHWSVINGHERASRVPTQDIDH
jgi:hypothetical protein